MTTRPSPVPHPLLEVIEDRAWTEFARCRGQLDLFFEPFREVAPKRAVREQRAKELCAGCPVQGPCRDSGRRNHESGIWGGETEEERVRAGFPIRTVTRTSTVAARSRALGPEGRNPPVAASCLPSAAAPEVA
jgi:WhiB family redox-sensing transcriptional regulator